MNDEIPQSIFSPNGRLQRLNYFCHVFAISLFANIPYVLGETIGNPFLTTVGTFTGIAGTVLCVFAAIKRCRDCGLNPHWCWLFLVPIANLGIAVLLLFKPTAKPVIAPID